MKENIHALKPYLLLWSTQTLSALGSGMTSYALVLWLYLRTGSALQTALLSVCSYAPYVVMSIFAGALCDRWDKKRTMLVCDLLAAASTLAVLMLIRADALLPWHLYALNALNGLMNTVQQPAGEVAATLLIPKRLYQKTSGLRSLSQSLNSILTPVLATALCNLLIIARGMRGLILGNLAGLCAALLCSPGLIGRWGLYGAAFATMAGLGVQSACLLAALLGRCKARFAPPGAG